MNATFNIRGFTCRKPKQNHSNKNLIKHSENIFSTAQATRSWFSASFYNFVNAWTLWHLSDIFIVLIVWYLIEPVLRKIGPRGVRALPLATGINVGGHYKWHFFLFFFFLSSSGSLLILPEGVVVGIQIFAWAPK